MDSTFNTFGPALYTEDPSDFFQTFFFPHTPAIFLIVPLVLGSVALLAEKQRHGALV
jgi:hypothetical protein